MRPLMHTAAAPLVVFLVAAFLSSQLQQVIGGFLVIVCLLVTVGMLLVPIDWTHAIPAERTSRIRRMRLLTAAFLLVLFVTISPLIWKRSLAAVAAEGDLVADAIARFESDQHRPPQSLRELVPQYLPALPNTGLRSSRKFHYSTFGESGDWSLAVPTSRGLLSGDSFKRNALKLYDVEGEWGRGEIVAGWLYQVD